MADYKAIVTGGAKGIGYAIASAILETGGKVCILDYSISDGEKAQKSFEEKYGNGKAVFVKCDVSKKNEMHDAFNQAKGKMGGLNVVCNNAALNVVVDERDRFDEMISVNLGGVINGSMLGLELMGKGYGGNGGVIINMASGAGLKPFPSLPVYSATKAGVVHFTRCIAQTSSSDHGVRVNCICPGEVYTDMMKFCLEVVWENKAKATQDVLDKFPKTYEEAREKYLKTSDISNEVMKIITDESKTGQVLLVLKNPDDLTVKAENV